MTFYHQAYARLRPALIAIGHHGVRFDTKGAKEKYAQLDARKTGIKRELDKIVGFGILYTVTPHRSQALVELYAQKRLATAARKAIPKAERDLRKEQKARIDKLSTEIAAIRGTEAAIEYEIGPGLSDDKIAKYFYGPLGLPLRTKKRKDSGKTSPTTDDITIRRFKLSHPEHMALFDLILEHRKCNKLMSYLDENKVDSDGRWRCHYKPFGTQTFRLASSENPLGTGGNLQNFDRSLKYLLLPDEDNDD